MRRFVGLRANNPSTSRSAMSKRFAVAPISTTMPSIRTFPAALATACAILITPAAAHASGWTTPEVLSADGAQISQLSDASANNRIAAAPDGSVTVAWIQNDGFNDKLYARRYSARTRSWGDVQEVSRAAEDLYTAGVVMDSDGNASAFWVKSDFSTVKAATLLADQNEWSAPEALATGGAYGFGAAAGPKGTVVVGIVESDHALRVHTRARNSAAWDATAPTEIVTDGTSAGGAISFDFNSTGDGVMLFAGDHSGSGSAYVTRYDHESQAWSTSPTAMFENVTAGFTGLEDVTIAPNGDIAAAICDGSFQLLARVLKADDTLAAQQSPGSGFRLIPAIGADDHNRFLLGWETLDLGTGDANGLYSVSDPSTGVWGTPAYLPGGEAGAPLGLLSTDDGVVRTVMADGLGLSSIADFQLSGSTWSSSTATWSTPDPIEGESVTVRNGFAATGFGHQPQAALAENGDAFAVWSQNLPGSTWGIGFAANDGSAPTLSSVSVLSGPAAAQTPVSFAASAADAWSDTTITWDFGDGTTGTGDNPSHAYATDGEYTVTARASNTAGLSSATRSLTLAVAAAPTDADVDPDPDQGDTPAPEKHAPVIEARLAGKTITLTAKITLRAGKSCSGKVTAKTSFGTTTYRTSLKLSKVDGSCVGTGTIKLRKAPSTRTKLRVTVSSKSIKTRTLTTKRG